MSISASLFNAYSGLVASARTVEAVSHNVSNALTEGYGKREVNLAAGSIGGRGAGVRVASVERSVDRIAIADRRLAQAEFGGQDQRAATFLRLENIIGIPGGGDALTDRITAFETALISAQSRPDSEVRLQNVLYAAKSVIGHINKISETTQDLRMEADKSINAQVNNLNSSLERIAELNRNIRLQSGGGQNVNGLLDQRQVLIDEISDIIPIKTAPRAKGGIAIFSKGGAVLLDGLPREFGFNPAGLITADMSISSGALSRLTLNGKDISPGQSAISIDGGSLSAVFATRDKTAPFASAQADSFARNLIERFEDSGLDATLSAGDAGLFTDAGNPFDAADETGLAGRLRLNNAVDPENGGETWRLRDGLGATSVGEVGNRSLLTGFTGALTKVSSPASGQFSAGGGSLSAIAGDLTSLNSAARIDAEQSMVFAQSRYQELYLTELASGVDTDQEMQKLLLIETAYAANAKVIASVDQMLQYIMEI